ncbi:MAG: GTP-binding protein [Thermoplasmata archaeon]|nr:MAG: GTP-binding protein [Thermoplasmata archaeon]
MRTIGPLKFKICLVGESAVGKTSLVRRYVFNEFRDKYVTTIGAKVTKKEITIKHPDGDGTLDVSLLIWDIIGQKSFRQLLQDAYFYGANGIIGVCDNTREKTLSELHSWTDAIHNITEDIPIVFLGNKSDLEEELELGLSELKGFASEYENAVPYLSSAKTGLNVEVAFKTLSGTILENMV